MSLQDKNSGRSVTLNTPRRPWRRGLVNNSTSGSFASLLTPTTTQPVAVDVSVGGATANTMVFDCQHNFTMLAFFGAGADNSTFDSRIWLWTEVNGPTPLWVPHLAYSATATLSSALPGIAGSPITSTELLADTLALTTGGVHDDLAVNSTTGVFSPGTVLAGAGTAYVLVDTLGSSLIQVEFDLTGATGANALMRQF